MKRIDCAGCSYCCEWTFIKVRTSKFGIKDIVKNTKDGFIIVGHDCSLDKKYFKLHYITVVKQLGSLIYAVPTKDVLYRRRGDVWEFRVNIRCKKLSKLGLCTIHNRKPKVCDDADCPIRTKKLKEDLESDWKKLIVDV